MRTQALWNRSEPRAQKDNPVKAGPVSRRNRAKANPTRRNQTRAKTPPGRASKIAAPPRACRADNRTPLDKRVRARRARVNRAPAAPVKTRTGNRERAATQHSKIKERLA